LRDAETSLLGISDEVARDLWRLTWQQELIQPSA
jgi:hypothetical protein